MCVLLSMLLAVQCYEEDESRRVTGVTDRKPAADHSGMSEREVLETGRR
jgi:hypothetical protein